MVMFVHICFILFYFQVPSLWLCEAVDNARTRRRFGSGTTKAPVDKFAKNIHADPMISAASNAEANKYSGGNTYSTDSGGIDYHQLVSFIHFNHNVKFIPRFYSEYGRH